MALALVFLHHLTVVLVSSITFEDIHKWAREIDSITGQIAGTFMGDAEFQNKMRTSCSFVEDDMEGQEIAIETARNLDEAFVATLETKDRFKNAIMQELQRVPRRESSTTRFDLTERLDKLAWKNSLVLAEDIEAEEDVLFDAAWTSRVYPYMASLLTDNTLIGSTFIGTFSGVLRQNPPIKLLKSEEKLEFRLQSWFIGKPEYQQVIIIIDTSSSMGLSDELNLSNAKDVATVLIKSFTSYVDFNVVSSSSMIWDLYGQPRKHSTVFVRCFEPPICEFYSANEQNKKAFLDLVWGLKPRGGTDLHRAFDMSFALFSFHKACKKTIYLITGGQASDKRVRCSSGGNNFMEENQKKFVPGDVCRFDVESTKLDVSVMQYFVNHSVDISTFVTTTQYLYYSRLSELACLNNGVSLWINSTKERMHSKMKLLTYLIHYASRNSGLLVETSSFTSKSMLSSLFFTEPIFASNVSYENEYDLDDEHGQQFVGVFGFAVHFSILRNFMLGHLWSGAYAFIVRSRDHLVKCYTSLISIHEISQVEMSLELLLNPRGEVTEFEQIERIVESMRPGTVVVRSNPGIPVMSKEGILVTIPLDHPLEIYFAPIPSVNYMLGVLNTGRRVWLRSCTEPTNPSLLHTKSESASINNMGSAVALLRRAFCSWHDFDLQYDPNNWERVENDMNSVPDTHTYTPCNGLLTNQARLETKATHNLEAIWASLSPLFSLLIHVKSRFILTNGGVFRILPPMVVPKETLKTITSHGWYREALENEGRVTFTQQKFSEDFLESEEIGIFISKSVYYPLNNCRTNVTRPRSCLVFGVFGMTGLLKDTSMVLSKAISKLQGSQCGTNSAKCYLISRNLDVSMQLSLMYGAHKVPTNLFEIHPAELRALVSSKIIMNLTYTVIMRKCRDSGNYENEKLDETVFHVLNTLGTPQTEAYRTTYRTSYERPCLKWAYQMMVNHSMFRIPTIVTSAYGSKCYHTTTYLSAIRDSSSYLMVVLLAENNTCLISEQLKMPFMNIFYRTKGRPWNITRCPEPAFVPVPCEISAASSRPEVAGLILAAIFFLGDVCRLLE